MKWKRIRRVSLVAYCVQFVCSMHVYVGVDNSFAVPTPPWLLANLIAIAALGAVGVIVMAAILCKELVGWCLEE